MPLARSQPASPEDRSPGASTPVSAILIMVAKGMTPREIVAVFPELTLDEVRRAVLQAAEVVRDENGSLGRNAESALKIVEQAQKSADLSDAEALKLAITETRAYRREKASRR